MSTIPELIGRQVRLARESRGFTQAALGHLLKPFLGKAWTPQVVSQAESGRRSFTAVELAALAWILEVPISWFFVPADYKERVQLPSGRSFNAADLVHAVAGSRFAEGEKAERREAILGTTETIRWHLQEQQEYVEHLRQLVLRAEEEAIVEEPDSVLERTGPRATEQVEAETERLLSEEEEDGVD